MFYIIRIIFFCVIFFLLSFLFFLFLKKGVKRGKKYSKKELRTYSMIYIGAVLLLTAVSFLPFESPFIRFDTVEESLQYKWISADDITVYSDDDCAFAVKGTYEIYSFVKDDRGYSYVNYQSKLITYRMPDFSEYNRSIHKLYAVYNKALDKTFYLLNVGYGEYPNDVVICESINFEYFAQPLFTKTFLGYTPILGIAYQYCSVTDGEPIQELIVEYDGQIKTFVK